MARDKMPAAWAAARKSDRAAARKATAARDKMPAAWKAARKSGAATGGSSGGQRRDRKGRFA
jgi:hypothetical protein